MRPVNQYEGPDHLGPDLGFWQASSQNLARTPSFQTSPYVSKYTGLVG